MYLGGDYMDKLYNISKAGQLLGVTRQTIYRWEKEGKFNFVEVNGFKKVSENDIKKMRGEHGEKM